MLACEERLQSVSVKRLDVNLQMRNGKAVRDTDSGSISTGAFIYASLLQKLRNLCLKEPFFQGYQRRLAVSAGVQVKLQMDVFTPGKMERKERENVSGYV